MNAPPGQLDFDNFSQLVPINALRRHNCERLHARSRTYGIKAGDTLFTINSRDADAIYLVEGTISLRQADDTEVSRVSAGSEAARHRIDQRNPHSVTARAETDVRYVRVDSALLDVLLTSDQTGTFEVVEIDGDGDAADGDWMAAMLQNRLFQRLAPEKLQSMFMRMESLDVNPGDMIIRQDDPGDYFYVLVRGRCGIFRNMPGRPHPLKVAELHPGACFGEDALISDAPRNATVVMLEAGALMRLAKADFQELLARAIVTPLDGVAARSQVAAGRAQWIDVRMPNEFSNQHLEGALNIPLFMLRAKLATLNKQQAYIVYCDGGKRSMVAAFVLQRHGFDAQFLANGLAGL